MATLTDPARAFADLCEKLRNFPTDQTGEKALAKFFEVDPWSSDFFKMLSLLSERDDNLRNIIYDSAIDEDDKALAFDHLDEIATAFSLQALGNKWSWSVDNYLKPANITPIRMLSGTIRPKISFPKLDEAEIASIRLEISELTTWIIEHQIDKGNFVSQSLLDGLNKLDFSVTRLGIVGWEYTLESLKEVISAYFALEREQAVDNDDPQVEAARLKITGFVKRFYQHAKFAKDISDVGDFMLKAYGATTTFIQSNAGIVGLLTGPS